MSKSLNLSSKTIKDPNHPTGIYFHPLPSSNQYAISLLPQSPSSAKSASIIGFIKDQSDQSGEIYDLAVRNPDLVEPNPSFVQLLHEVLKSEGVPQDGLLEYEAYLRTDGFAHVSDPRHPLMPGRIPTPENIIAVRLKYCFTSLQRLFSILTSPPFFFSFSFHTDGCFYRRTDTS